MVIANVFSAPLANVVAGPSRLFTAKVAAWSPGFDLGQRRLGNVRHFSLYDLRILLDHVFKRL